ncbi:membrane protein [Gordonia phage Biskit]|uniref:Uncharacterized protein n=2 Tax=Emalynvirus troje TaxID=2560511 RepID=A0A2K9VER2_9CAUD|nr:hypothetical protein FDJ27_gp35 [Gordonia phage Troje]AUV60741.1 hypothetical protein SEA_TROJE_35 [Gordonia phage Troje]AXH45134.1 hypothetical protein SEA_SKETCHMEX_34 [Gordonia phage SketchMex]UVK62075.1 membrane protein [Gordonia phage Biskit]
MKGDEWAVLAAWVFIVFFILYLIAQGLRVLF